MNSTSLTQVLGALLSLSDRVVIREPIDFFLGTRPGFWRSNVLTARMASLLLARTYDPAT